MWFRAGLLALVTPFGFGLGLTFGFAALSASFGCSASADGDDAGDAATGGADGVGGTSSGGADASGGAAGSGGGAPAAGGATGGSTGGDACVPNASGTLAADGDVVFDERTCLTWTQANTSGDPYAEAVTYCDGLSLGGYDDWRLPTAGEVVSIFECDGTYPPVRDVFTVAGDGIWTTTESGTIAGDQTKVCGAGQSSGMYYDFGKVGGQNTRCVRGTVTLPDRTDCKSVTQICIGR